MTAAAPGSGSDLEREFAQLRQEVARLRRELTEAWEQQSTTGDMLRLISSRVSRLGRDSRSIVARGPGEPFLSGARSTSPMQPRCPKRICR